MNAMITISVPSTFFLVVFTTFTIITAPPKQKLSAIAYDRELVHYIAVDYFSSSSVIHFLAASITAGSSIFGSSS